MQEMTVVHDHGNSGQNRTVRDRLLRIPKWLISPLLSTAIFMALLLVLHHKPELIFPSSDEKVFAEGLQLKTLIRQVKNELQEAGKEAVNKNEAALFELKDFDLDVNIVAKGTSNVNAQIVTVGTNVEIARERLQHVHLHWVVDAKSRPVDARRGAITESPDVVIDADTSR
jgi:hypothetical protein